MTEAKVTNPKDYQVVSFHNKEDFGFTPEMGCMYDGRAINSGSGAPGIEPGETKVLPYHIGHQLALNLAKYVLNRGSSKETKLDAAGQPIIQAIWDTNRLEDLKNSYLTDMYTEEKPVAQSETDKLFAKMAELEKFVRDSAPEVPVVPVEAPSVPETGNAPIADVNGSQSPVVPRVYQDKKEVIEALTEKEIKFDARKNKAELEKLLA